VKGYLRKALKPTPSYKGKPPSTLRFWQVVCRNRSFLLPPKAHKGHSALYSL
jgi:hypothetical protein